MIWDSVLNVELAEPAMREVHLNFATDQPLRADRKDISQTEGSRRDDKGVVGVPGCLTSTLPPLNKDIQLANCGQTQRQHYRLSSVWDGQMAFMIVAERDTETVRMKTNSSLVAIAKARVWASEGWNVTVVVDDELAEVQEPLKLLAYAS